MNNRGMLNPGPLAVSKINWLRILVGIFLLFFAFAIYIAFPALDERFSGNFTYALMAPFLLMGVSYIIAAFSRNANTLYLKNGKCTILEGSIGCSGGCKKCSFVNTYMNRIIDDSVSIEDEGLEQDL